MDPIRVLENRFRAYRESGALESGLYRWQMRWPGLAELDLEALIAACRRKDAAPRELKDAIHVALCIESRSTGNDAEFASTLLYWLFLPGLLFVSQEICALGVLDPDDVTAEMLAGFWEAASKVRGDSHHVARHLVRGARRRALHAVQQATSWNRSIESLDEVMGDALLDDPQQGDFDDLLERALKHGIVTPLDIKVLLADRSGLVRLADKRGVSAAALRQTRARAKARLRPWLTAPDSTGA